MKICAKCGAANSASAKFCNECGFSLNAAPEDVPLPLPSAPTPVVSEPKDVPATGVSPAEGLATAPAEVEIAPIAPQKAVEATPAAATSPVSFSVPESVSAPVETPSSPVPEVTPDQPAAAPPPSAPSSPAPVTPPAGFAGLGGGSNPSSSHLNIGELTAVLSKSARRLEGRRKADILFVLDCTASMAPELKVMKEAILSFTDTIVNAGVETRVGMIAFRDRHQQGAHPGEEALVMDFGGTPFTKDAEQFRQVVQPLTAGGGGDLEESSLDAILLALRQPFDPDADKVIVLVTDAPPKIPDVEAQSVAQVSAAIQQAGVRQIYLVIRVQEKANNAYLQLLERTDGLAFDLGYGDDFSARAENFKRTLLQLGKTISKGTR